MQQYLSWDATDFEKPRYLINETFFLQIKLHIKGYFMAKNTFVLEKVHFEPVYSDLD